MIYVHCPKFSGTNILCEFIQIRFPGLLTLLVPSVTVWKYPTRHLRDKYVFWRAHTHKNPHTLMSVFIISATHLMHGVVCHLCVPHKTPERENPHAPHINTHEGRQAMAQ